MDPELDPQYDAEPQAPSAAKIKKDLTHALQILSQTSPSNTQVKKYNTIIISHLSQSEGLNVLLQLLIFSQGNETRSNLAISFICYYIRLQVRPGVGVKRQDKKVINDKIKNLFFSSFISNKGKRMLLNGYIQFLSALNSQTCKLRRNLCEQIVQFFYQKQGISSQQLSSILYLVQAVLNSNLQSQSLRLLQQNLLAHFIKLSLELIRQISKILSQLSQQTLIQQLNKKIEWCLRVLKITSLLFTSANIDKLFILKKTIMLSPDLANLCIESIKLSIVRQSFIIKNQGNIKCNQINQIKVQVLKILNDSLKFMLKSKKNIVDSKHIPVLQTIKQYTNYVVPALSRELDGYPSKQIQSEQLLKQALLALAKVVAFPCLLETFSQIRDVVLFKICLPCIMTTPYERQLSPQDFCQRRQKLINFQNQISANQAAVSLIQAYSDQVYGTVPYLIKSIINLMDFQLTADPNYFQSVPSLLFQTDFFKNHSHYQQIQVGLSILAILSYQADNRDDIPGIVEQFIVRRQLFFSRVDIPESLIVSFLHCCSYYIQNFYQLIVQGKANANFHQSLIFHTLQLLNYSFDENKKSFKTNQTKKIAIQAIDYISNSVIQPRFFSAIFPAWNQKSPQLLISLFERLSNFYGSTVNIKIIDTIFIDFSQRCIERCWKDNNNWAGLPDVVKNQLSKVFVDKINQNFKSLMPNQTIIKQKMFQLYSLILKFSQNPGQLLQSSIPIFTHIVQTQFSFIEELLDVLKQFLHRAVKQKIQVQANLHQILTQSMTKALKICDNQKYQNQVFDAVLNLNILQIGQQQIVQILLQVFQQRLSQRDKDQEAQIIMEKTLYMMLQIAFSNFNLVLGTTWMRILDRMIEYMRVYYKTNDTITVGKATCICLCCYLQDPEGMQKYMGNRLQGLWDCILDDQLKYFSKTQKKIALTKYSQRQIIKDKFISIVRTCCIIMYYIYQKSEISYKQSDSQDDGVQEEGNEQDKKKAWQQPLNTIRENQFLKNLPDQKVLLKNICVKLNETQHQNFQKFIQDLPIGLQNLVKNKILMYREDTGIANKPKMRTILKVKKMNIQ